MSPPAPLTCSCTQPVCPHLLLLERRADPREEGSLMPQGTAPRLLQAAASLAPPSPAAGPQHLPRCLKWPHASWTSALQWLHVAPLYLLLNGREDLLNVVFAWAFNSRGTVSHQTWMKRCQFVKAGAVVYARQWWIDNCYWRPWGKGEKTKYHNANW